MLNRLPTDLLYQVLDHTLHFSDDRLSALWTFRNLTLVNKTFRSLYLSRESYYLREFLQLWLENDKDRAGDIVFAMRALLLSSVVMQSDKWHFQQLQYRDMDKLRDACSAVWKEVPEGRCSLDMLRKMVRAYGQITQIYWGDIIERSRSLPTDTNEHPTEHLRLSKHFLAQLLCYFAVSAGRARHEPYYDPTSGSFHQWDRYEVLPKELTQFYTSREYYLQRPIKAQIADSVMEYLCSEIREAVGLESLGKYDREGWPGQYGRGDAWPGQQMDRKTLVMVNERSKELFGISLTEYELSRHIVLSTRMGYIHPTIEHIAHDFSEEAPFSVAFQWYTGDNAVKRELIGRFCSECKDKHKVPQCEGGVYYGTRFEFQDMKLLLRRGCMLTRLDGKGRGRGNHAAQNPKYVIKF